MEIIVKYSDSRKDKFQKLSFDNKKNKEFFEEEDVIAKLKEMWDTEVTIDNITVLCNEVSVDL